MNRTLVSFDQNNNIKWPSIQKASGVSLMQSTAEQSPHTNERTLYSSVINSKIADAMNRTHYERSQKERKIRDLLDSVEKGKAKKKFLNNMRI